MGGEEKPPQQSSQTLTFEGSFGECRKVTAWIRDGQLKEVYYFGKRENVHFALIKIPIETALKAKNC